MTPCLRISARDRRIVCLWLAGEKSEVIAAELGSYRGVITRRAATLGLPPRMPGGGGAAKQINLWPYIVAWAKAGFSPVEIAAGIRCRRPEVVAGIDASPAPPLTKTRQSNSGAAKPSLGDQKRMALALTGGC